MQIKRYKMFWEREYIADFVEYHKDTGVELNIEIIPTCDLTQFKFYELNYWQKNRVVGDEGVRFWMDERCTPATQDGIDEKLKLWGLSEYDQLSIMHQSGAVNPMDRYWIQFNPKMTFDENHPHGNNFKCMLKDWY
jgi:hypothetical protein